MGRVKIDLPSTIKFQTKVTVRVNDLNYGGHVGNDNVLTIMHEARLQYLKSLGFKDELSIGEDIGIIVADAAIVYKAESFHGDQLVIDISIDDFNKYGFSMFYKITNAENGKEVARGKTGIICMNYKERKIAGIPPNLLKLLQTQEL